SHFYTEWFLCFMTNDHYSMNDDKERKKYQELLKAWTSCFETDQSKFHVMMMKINKLMDPFVSAPIGSNAEKCCELFVHQMIDICFKQGKIFMTSKFKKTRCILMSLTCSAIFCKSNFYVKALLSIILISFCWKKSSRHVSGTKLILFFFL